MVFQTISSSNDIHSDLLSNSGLSIKTLVKLFDCPYEYALATPFHLQHV